MSSKEHVIFTETQNPHAGRTLSHFVFLARHTWQALELLFRGYRVSEVLFLGRFLDAGSSCTDSSGRIESIGSDQAHGAWQAE